MSALLGLLLAMMSVDQSSDGGCAGGAIVFFEPGSDGLAPNAIERLTGYADASRRQNADSDIYIESGGDGTLATFNPALSRRRSEAIRSFLLAHHFPANRVHVQVQQSYGTRAPYDTDDATIMNRIGHVYELVSREEYGRLYPPGMIMECF